MNDATDGSHRSEGMITARSWAGSPGDRCE
ncbi:hypothetical protein FB564_0648 [Salinispora arenicola]|uniref:Uncharacterized protein n=1 Tax=Salinispora arenicola TaxID=168697 RepID=A0A542XIF8_SALAC|nr:hypothetical protein FB564_0648 [Salinispora arenicola]